MIATINKMTDIMGGQQNNTPMLLVDVTKADGTTKAYKLAKFKKDICEKMMRFGPGDAVDITFKENKRGFMDIVDVKKSDAGAPVAFSGGGYRKGVADSGKNKGVALSYVMRYVLPQTHTESNLRKMGAEEYIVIATSLADEIVEYLEGKKSSGMDTQSGSTSAVAERRTAEDGRNDIPTPDIGAGE